MSKHLKDNNKDKPEKKIVIEEIDDFDFDEYINENIVIDENMDFDDNEESTGPVDNEENSIQEENEEQLNQQQFDETEIVEKKRTKSKKASTSKNGKKGILIALATVAVLCLALLLGAYLVTNSQKNLPNVYVAGIDVSKLTKAQTMDKLTAENWDGRTTSPFKLSLLGVVDVEIDPVESGFMLSKEDAAEKANLYGHDKGMFKNLITFIKSLFGKTDINKISSKANDSYLDSKLMEGFDWMNELYGLEEFHLDYESGVISTRKGWGQIDFDKADIKNQIELSLHNGDKELKYMTVTKTVTMPDFNTLNSKFPKEAKDAAYTDDGKFDVVDEVIAANFDIAAAEEIWKETELGQTVKIPMIVTKPEITGEKLRSQLFHDMLGAMSTRYTNSIENRCSNVRLCASKINEKIVYPGEEFSYNEVVGKRTEEAGFLPAPAYVGLDAEETVKDEIGGGCCQVSSTLYAATLFSFLETVERSNHIYPVNYMMLGIDATVTIPEDGQEVNFKFKNNKNYPIKIVAYTNENEEEKKLTVEIWGTLEEDDYMPVEFDARYLWTQDYDRFIEKADPNREGYKIKLEIDRYTDAGPYGTLTSTQTWRKVFNSAGELVAEEITNLPNPATGQPSMDQYNEHK